MTYVTCRLTAKSRDQLRNPMLGNRVWAAFTVFYWHVQTVRFGAVLSVSAEHCTASEMQQDTHTHTQPFNGPFFGITWVGQYQKKRSPTHVHSVHQTSFVNFLHLLRFVASSVFNLHA